MAAVNCFRCGNGGYTTPPIRAAVPSLLEIPGNVVVQEVALCAPCRAKAAQECKAAAERSAQRGEAG